MHVINPFIRSVFYKQSKITSLWDLNLYHDCNELSGDQSSENGVLGNMSIIVD